MIPPHDRGQRPTEDHLPPPPGTEVQGAPPAAARPTAPDPVVEVPGYRLDGELARGGMGVVYRATDLRLNRSVAVKVLQEAFAARPAAVGRFLEEAQITAQLQHPGIPPVHQVGVLADGRPFLAMKLIKGQTLAALLAERALDPGQLAGVFEQVCQAVAYAHGHGVIHRDLKPANVMVGAFGEVQVMDWGLAKVRAATGERPAAGPTDTAVRSPRAATDELATTAGTSMGTPAYMPPEQALGTVERVDERSDVFGLGGILCEALTGTPPYAAGDAESTRRLAAQAKLGDALARLDSCGADPELVALCRRCLSPDPADRPADAGEVAHAVAALRAAADERVRTAELNRVQAKADLHAARLAEAERRHRWRWRAALAAGMVVVATTALGFLWWRGSVRDQQERERLENQEKLAGTRAEQATAELVFQRRQVALLELANRRSVVRHAGWAEADWNLAQSAAALRPGSEPRDAAVSTLVGIDARPEHQPEFSAVGESGFGRVVFSRDGRLVLSGGYGEFPATVLDRASGVLSSSPHCGDGPVRFRPDGGALQVVLPTAGRDSILLWDVLGDTDLGTIRGVSPPGTKVVASALSEDAGLLAVAIEAEGGAPHGTVTIWNTATHTEVRHVDRAATELAFSPAGTHLAVGDADGAVALYPIAGGDPVPLPNGIRRRASISTLSFGANARRGPGAVADRPWLLAVGDEAGSLSVWDLGRLRLVSHMTGSQFGLSATAFTPDGSMLMSVGRNYPRIWDVATGRLLLELELRNYLAGVAVSPDGSAVATTTLAAFSETTRLDVWTLENGRGVHTLRGLGDPVRRVWLSPTGRWAVGLSNDWELAVWDANTGRLQLLLEAPPGYFTDSAAVAFPPGERELIFCSGRRATRWSVADGNPTGRWQLPPGLMDHLAIGPDGRPYLFRLETADGKRMPGDPHDKLICRTRELFDDGRTDEVWPPLNELPAGAVTSPDGRRIALVLGPNRSIVRVLDPASGKIVSEDTHPGSKSCGFEPGGLLAISDNWKVVGEKKPLRFLDVETGAEVRTAPEGDLHDFGAGGKIYGAFAGAAAPKTVRFFWTGESDPYLAVNLIDRTTSQDLVFSRDGRYCFWGNEDGTVNMCDLPEVERKTLPFVGSR